MTVFNSPPVGSHIPSSGSFFVHAWYAYVCSRRSQILFLSERQDLLSPCMIDMHAYTDWTSVYCSHPNELRV